MKKNISLKLKFVGLTVLLLMLQMTVRASCLPMQNEVNGICVPIYGYENNYYTDGYKPNSSDCPECIWISYHGTSYPTKTVFYATADRNISPDTFEVIYTYENNLPSNRGALTASGYPNTPDYFNWVNSVFYDSVKDGHLDGNSEFGRLVVSTISKKKDCSGFTNKTLCAEAYILESLDKSNQLDDGVGLAAANFLWVKRQSDEIVAWIQNSDGYSGIKGSYLVENMCSAINAGDNQTELGIRQGKECTATFNYAGKLCPYEEYNCDSGYVEEKQSYFNNKGIPVTKEQYEEECLKPRCEIKTDENGKTVYYGHDRTVVSKEQYEKECKCVCYDDNICYDDKGNEVSREKKIITCDSIKNVCTTEVIDGKTIYYGKKGTEVSKSKWEKDCTCIIVNGRYLGKNGQAVTKSRYEKECGGNPDEPDEPDNPDVPKTTCEESCQTVASQLGISLNPPCNAPEIPSYVPVPDDVDIPSPEVPEMTCGVEYNAADLKERGEDIGQSEGIRCHEYYIYHYDINVEAISNDTEVKAGNSFDWGYTRSTVRKTTTKSDGSVLGANKANLELEKQYWEKLIAYYNGVSSYFSGIESSMSSKRSSLEDGINSLKNQIAEIGAQPCPSCDGCNTAASCGSCAQAVSSCVSSKQKAISDLNNEISKLTQELNLTIALETCAKGTAEAYRKQATQTQNAYDELKRTRLDAEEELYARCTVLYENASKPVEVKTDTHSINDQVLSLSGVDQKKGSVLAINKNNGDLIYAGQTYDNGFGTLMSVSKDNLPSNSLAVRNSDLFVVDIKTKSGIYERALKETFDLQVSSSIAINDVVKCDLIVYSGGSPKCSDPPCDPPVVFSCSNPPCDDEINVIFRPISLTNPFPNASGTDSEMRNRTGKWSYDSVVEKIISQNRNVQNTEVYNLTPMYTITLTPSTIKDIREYNKSHSYSGMLEDEFKCVDGLYCTSNFLRDILPSYDSNVFDYSASCALSDDWYACDGLDKDYMEGFYSHLKVRKEAA